VSVVLVIVAALLGIAAAGSAVQKLRRAPMVVETMHSVGVPDRMIPVLAVLELAGAAGLLVGIWLPALGVAAAAGLTLYFLGAAIAHARTKAPAKDALPAVALLILSVVTLILEVLR